MAKTVDYYLSKGTDTSPRPLLQRRINLFRLECKVLCMQNNGSNYGRY